MTESNMVMLFTKC